MSAWTPAWDVSPMSTTCGNYSDFTVSIVSYNSRDVLGECLKSLPEGIQVRVFDNASSDGSVAFLRDQFPDVKVIASAVNMGFGRGHNANLDRITTPFALILNPDCFLNQQAISEMASIIRNHPKVALVGPGAEGTVSASSERYRDYGPGIVNPHHVEQLSGHCVMVRISAFADSGFFDPNLFLFYEDTDLCMKARLLGHVLVLAPQTEVRHLIGQSTPKSWKTTLRRDYHLGWSEAYYRCKYRQHQTRAFELFRVAFKHARKGLVRLLRLSPKTIESACRIYGVLAYSASGLLPADVAVPTESETSQRDDRGPKQAAA